MGRKPKYKQGKYNPIQPDKYKGNTKGIVYRSGLELNYFRYMDLNSNVVKWASEEIFIPYTSIDGKQHRYFVDLWCKVKDKDGEFKEYLIEIKPFTQCFPPKQQKRITKAYKERVATFFKNMNKWEAANIFAEKNNCKFVIFCEKFKGYTYKDIKDMQGNRI